MAIRGDFDGMHQAQATLQAISDETGNAVSQLGNQFEVLGTALQGQASGDACQRMGERLITSGNQFVTSFGDHSHMMGNNIQIFQAADEENQHLINAIAGHQA